MANHKHVYLAALEAFNNSKETNEPLEIQKEMLRNFRNKAIDFFNCVENSISSTELSGGFKSDFWAKDLSNTAANILESIANFYEKYDREAERLGLENLVPSKNAYSGMQSTVAIYNHDQVEELKSRFISLELPVRGFIHPIKMNKRYKSWEKLAMFLTVIGFLCIMVAIGLWNRTYTPEGFWIFRVVLSLVAGAFTAIAIPGSLRVEAKLGKFAIKAVGAVGVLVIVYLLNPPALLKNNLPPPIPDKQTETPRKATP